MEGKVLPGTLLAFYPGSVHIPQDLKQEFFDKRNTEYMVRPSLIFYYSLLSFVSFLSSLFLFISVVGFSCLNFLIDWAV